MQQLNADTNWDSLVVLVAYGILICLYLITLKLLMNCIEQLMSSKHGSVHRSVIDIDIRREAANHHADDKMHTLDVYNFALIFLKIAIILGGIVGIFILIVIKLNVFFAFGIAALIGLVVWQLYQWHQKKGKEVIRHYESLFIEVGGYNIGTLIFFALALIFITLGLILLP